MGTKIDVSLASLSKRLNQITPATKITANYAFWTLFFKWCDLLSDGVFKPLDDVNVLYEMYINDVYFNSVYIKHDADTEDYHTVIFNLADWVKYEGGNRAHGDYSDKESLKTICKYFKSNNLGTVDMSSQCPLNMNQ